MALFLSTFTNKIDAKGRVSVPAQFRNMLSGLEFSGIVVYESFINNCIEGCDIERIKQMSDSIDSLDTFSEERDAFAATILGGAIQLSIDKDGRVFLPEKLIKQNNITDKVLFVGKGPTFEIWNPEEFEAYLENAKKSAKEKRNLLNLNKKSTS